MKNSGDNREVSCAAVFNEYDEMLLVKNGKYWITPGGKIEEYETREQALERELKEELDFMDMDRLEIDIEEHYSTYAGITPCSGKKRRFHLYVVTLDQEVEGVSAEIDDYGWFREPMSYSFSGGEKISEITERMVTDLKIERYF